MEKTDADDMKEGVFGGGVRAADVETMSGEEDDYRAMREGKAAIHSPHRKLELRHLQLIAIAGSIGSGLFISIGNALTAGGPVSLLLGISWWCSVIIAVSNFQLEMTTLLPLDGGFIRYASRFVDDAIGMALGWNYFITNQALICYELTVVNVVISYWKSDLNPAIMISVIIVLYAALNSWTVRLYGETEFWVALLKFVLIGILFLFTFITMCGGNPIGDKYGFRNWKDPAPILGSNAGERFEGIMSSISFAAFAVVGPDYLSLLSGEVKNPRRVLPKAFKSTMGRMIIFYIFGAFFVGTVCASNSPELLGAISAGAPGAAKSPYVIAMNRLQVKYLPDVVNALILVSIISSGNAFTYATSRSLHGLALQGHAPKVFRRLNRNGVPYTCTILVSLLTGLSYLQVSAGTYKVLNWWINLCTCAQLVTWVLMAVTYICFDRSLKAQGLKGTDFLPAKGFMPLASAWYTAIFAFAILWGSGYYVFLPGAFNPADFVFAYGSIFVFLFLAICWKLIHRIPAVNPKTADFVSDLAELDEYTQECERVRALTPRSKSERIWDALF